MTEHLDILEPKEIYALYGRPHFNEQQLTLFFEFTEEELSMARRFRTYSSRGGVSKVMLTKIKATTKTKT